MAVRSWRSIRRSTRTWRAQCRLRVLTSEDSLGADHLRVEAWMLHCFAMAVTLVPGKIVEIGEACGGAADPSAEEA